MNYNNETKLQEQLLETKLPETDTSTQTDCSDTESVNSEQTPVKLSKRQRVAHLVRTYVTAKNVGLFFAAVTSLGLVVGTGYTAKRYIDARSVHKN